MRFKVQKEGSESETGEESGSARHPVLSMDRIKANTPTHPRNNDVWRFCMDDRRRAKVQMGTPDFHLEDDLGSFG